MNAEAPSARRDPLGEVETQRDDLLVYLSAARAIVDVGATAQGLDGTAREIARVLVHELGVEACAVTLRDRADSGLHLAGFAAQSDVFGAPAPALGETGWIALAGLVGTQGEPTCFRRDADGGFTAVPPSVLETDGFTALPFAIGDERHGVIVLHTVIAPAQRFARLQGLALLADMVGQALTVARTRDAAARLCDKLSLELGVSRRRLTTQAQSLRAREDSIERLTRELARSNGVKTEFLGTISHELRTPLNAVLGYAELLHDGYMGTLDPEQSTAVSRVLSAARTLHMRVEDVLFFVQMEADRVGVRADEVDLARACDQALTALAERPRPAAVALAVLIDPAARTATTDAGLLGRILFHLLDNAFKFTDQGTVTVTIQPGARAEDLEIVVRDTGVGIPLERQRAIFDAFVQADSSDTRRFDGLGMGLALVHRATALLGGRVGVESVVGEGSAFTVVLPGALADTTLLASA